MGKGDYEKKYRSKKEHLEKLKDVFDKKQISSNDYLRIKKKIESGLTFLQENESKILWEPTKVIMAKDLNKK